MNQAEYKTRLAELGRDLKAMEADLTRSWQANHSSHTHCDEWCKLWMLLAGSWYSLAWSLNCLDDVKPLKDSLPEAHQFALGFLASCPNTIAATDMNSWFTGYFLISTEHRIANTIDRATKLFFYPKKVPDKLYARCTSLLLACPHCAQPASSYLTSSLAILTGFAAHPSITSLSMEAWTKASPLARVYDRVNSLKHKKPDKDAVSDLPTADRWNDAAVAVGDLASFMRDLVRHWTSDEAGDRVTGRSSRRAARNGKQSRRGGSDATRG